MAGTGGAAGWHADPYGTHEYRYFDGTVWTEHVADGGTPSTDAVNLPPTSSVVRSPRTPNRPPPSPHYAPATPPQTIVVKQKRGFGVGCLALIGGAVVVLIVLVLLVAIFGDTDKAKPDHEGADDVTLTACAPSGLGGYWRSAGAITNHSSKRSDYSITIGYFQGTTRVGRSSTFEGDIDPGGTAVWESGDLGSGDVVGAVECRVVDVSRHASF